MVEAAPQSRVSSPELGGRREELRALEDELSRAAAGEFRLVLLLGDAGVGKSRGPAIDVAAVERLDRDGGPAKLRRFVPLTAERALTATAWPPAGNRHPSRPRR